MPIAASFAAVPYSVGELAGALTVTAGSAWLLGLVFMFAAYCVSLAVRTKAQALAILILIWLAAVLLYDLGLLVAAVSFTGGLPRGVLNALMLANPASASGCSISRFSEAYRPRFRLRLWQACSRHGRWLFSRWLAAFLQPNASEASASVKVCPLKSVGISMCAELSV